MGRGCRAPARSGAGVATCLLAVVTLGACSGPSIQIETVAAPTIRPSELHKVILLPVVNRSDDQQAGMAMRAVLSRALATQARLQVLDLPPGVAANAEKLDRDQARELATAVGADAVVTAELFAYGYVPAVRTAQRPAIRLDVRVMSGREPVLLWAARASAFDSPGMGSGGATLTSMADAAVRRLVADFSTPR